MDIYRLEAIELKKLLAKGELSAREVTQHLLEYIQKHDSQVRAFLLLDERGALAAAEQWDRRRARGENLGLLGGIPIAIKDNICTTGLATTCGSRMLQNFIPPYDAHVIERIKAEGGIIVGKTNMDEFAMGSSCENSSFFPTRNPWKLDCIPGGSSGGSAAAVAAGMTPLALGSDTGGSIRQPAALCGLVGFKPTYGRVSRYGLVAFGSSLDQIGSLTRTVRDTALVMQTIAGHDVRDSTCAQTAVPAYSEMLETESKWKLGIPAQAFEGKLDAEISAAVQKAIAVLKNLGATVVPVSLPHIEYSIPVYYLVATAEASANLSRYDGIHYGYRAIESEVISRRQKELTTLSAEYEKLEQQHASVRELKNAKKEIEEHTTLLEDLYAESRSRGFGSEVKRRILLGTYALSSGYYDAYYLKALQVRTLIKRDLEEAFTQVDAVLMPTSPLSAFPLGEKMNDPLAMYLCDIFTTPSSLSGHPTVSIPCGATTAKLPIGFQIIGKFFEELTVLRIARAYERAANHPVEIPHLG